MDDDRLLGVGGRRDVELQELRELLGLGRRRVDGDAAGRHAVLPEFAEAREIRGAEEGDPVLGAPVVALARFVQPEAGEAASEGSPRAMLSSGISK